MQLNEHFSSSQVMELTGVTRRQLAYWRQTGLVVPSEMTEGGHGRYTFHDLIALRTTKRLIDSGVSLQRVRRSISSLIKFLPTIRQPLTEVSLVATGDVVLVFSQGTAFDALSGQEWVFPVAELARDVDRLRRTEDAEPVQEELFPGWRDTGGHGSPSGSGRAA